MSADTALARDFAHMVHRLNDLSVPQVVPGAPWLARWL